MIMNLKPAVTLLAGVALGALTIGGLNAQSKAPGAYAVVDITEVTDPEAFKQLGPLRPQWRKRAENISLVPKK